MELISERSTTLKMTSSTSKSTTSPDDGWLAVYTNGLDETWVDVEQRVPNDIDHSASNVAKGAFTVGGTAVSLRTLRKNYSKETSKACRCLLICLPALSSCHLLLKIL